MINKKYLEIKELSLHRQYDGAVNRARLIKGIWTWIKEFSADYFARRSSQPLPYLQRQIRRELLTGMPASLRQVCGSAAKTMVVVVLMCVTWLPYSRL